MEETEDVQASLLEPEPNDSDATTSSKEAKAKAKKERQLEALLSTAGYGLFHVLLLLVIGLATAADSVEIFGVSFVLPIADQDLDLSTAHKGYLDASIFIGERN